VKDKGIQHTVQKVQLEVVAKILAEFEGIPNHRIAACHFAGIEFSYFLHKMKKEKQLLLSVIRYFQY
jgi:hypothetical protein